MKREPTLRAILGRRMFVATLGASLGIVALAACSASDKNRTGASSDNIPELSVDEVETRIAKKDGSFFVFDVNPKEVFDAGHVPTAKWIEAVEASVLPTDKTASLVFYCANER
jgi:hypothetical protein